MRSLKILIVSISLVILTVTSIASSQTNIVDSIEFEGNEKVINIADAKEIAVKNNPEVIKKQVEIEKAYITSIKYNDAARETNRSSLDSKSIMYLQGVKMNEIMRDYAQENAKKNYDTTVLKVKAEAEQAYYSALQAEQSLTINKDNLKVAQDTYNITKKKFDLGLVAKQELLNSELNRIKAEKDVRSSEVSVKNAKMSLNLKLGLEIMTNLKLKDDLKFVEYKLGSIAEAVNSALNSRNEIKAAEYAYQLQDINTQVEKAKNEFSNSNKQAQLSIEQAAKDLENSKNNIELEVRSNYLDIQQKADEVKTGEKSVEITAEALKIAQISYEKGMNTFTDVQKAQVALQQAKLGLSKSVLDYKLAILKYEDSTKVGRTAIANTSQASN